MYLKQYIKNQSFTRAYCRIDQIMVNVPEVHTNETHRADTKRCCVNFRAFAKEKEANKPELAEQC